MKRWKKTNKHHENVQYLQPYHLATPNNQAGNLGEGEPGTADNRPSGKEEASFQ